jgi:tetratricopeptide (TPR) repeat protein
MQLAELLYRSGKLKDTDIKGYGKSQTASGHIVNNTEVLLKDIEIAGLHYKNVEAVIIEGQNVPLLLGLSAIQKLGKVTLSGNKLIIDSSIIASSQLKQLRDQINAYINDERYEDAIGLLKKIEAQDALEEVDAFNLAHCYCYSRDYNKTLLYCQGWMGSYKGTNTLHEPDICYYMAMAYNGLKSFHDADAWFAKAIEQISLDAIERTSIEDCNKLSYYYNQKALNYQDAEVFDYSVEAFDLAAQYRMRFLGYTAEDLCSGKIKDGKVGACLFSIGLIYAVFIRNDAKAERYLVLAALCGNKDAIAFCEHLHLKYKL